MSHLPDCLAFTSPPLVYCSLRMGHHGPYRASSGKLDWPNESELTPCPSTDVAALGVAGGPVRLRCGLLEAHAGPHVFSLQWEARP